MNLSQLLAGAANMDEVCRGSDWRRNPALFGAAVKYLAARDHGASIEVFMPYAMRLKALGEWYVQLLAESLGKREDRNGQTVFYGRTPLVAIGTTDMHAQTQLHQDGIRDKVVQFLFIDSLKGKSIFIIPSLKSSRFGLMKIWMSGGPWKLPWKQMKRPL